MYCKNCGREIDDGMTLCDACCGADLPEKADDTALTAAEENESVQTATNTLAEEVTPEESVTEEAITEEPVVKEAEKTDVAGKVKAKKPYRKLGFGRATLALLLSLLLIATFAAAAVFGVIQKSVSRDNVASVVESLSVKSLDLSQLRISDLGLEKLDSPDGVSVSEYIFLNINPEAAEKYNIDAEKIERIIAESTLDEAVSEKLSDYIDFFLYNKEAPELDADDIMDLVKDNEQLVQQITGYLLTRDDYYAIEEELEKLPLESISGKALQQKAGNAPLVISYITSPLIFWAVIAVAVILAALLAFVTRFRVKPLFLCLSIPLAIAGQLLLFGYTFAVGAHLTAGTEVLDVVAASLRCSCLNVGAAMLSLGLLLRLISSAIKTKNATK